MHTRKSFVCPFCHAEVPEGAPACPECGSDEQTGWSEDPFGIRSGTPEAPNRPKRNGIRFAAYTVVAGLFVAALVLSRVAISALPLFLVAVFAVLLGGFLYERIRNYTGADIHEKLLSKARGDEELVERLVDFERRKNPFRTRKQLLIDALERWENDSR
jgi:hypothetical protein